MHKANGTARQSSHRSRLIAAFLQNPRMEKAAKSIGISPTTAWRISKTPEFQEEYRQARIDAFLQAARRMQEATNGAVTTLLEVMKDPKAPVATRVRVAELVLEWGARSFESEDLEVRVRRLEEEASKKTALENRNVSVSKQ